MTVWGLRKRLLAAAQVIINAREPLLAAGAAISVPAELVGTTPDIRLILTQELNPISSTSYTTAPGTPVIRDSSLF
jgi:hypothetical protein